MNKNREDNEENIGNESEEKEKEENLFRQSEATAVTMSRFHNVKV